MNIFTTIFELFQYPFMQRAILAGVALAMMLAYLGIFVVLRRMAFFGEGIAHTSLAGVAIGILIGVSPIYTALAFGVGMAIMIYILERRTNLSSDAAIGIIFTGGMALGVLLLSLKKGYQPELVSFLFGNILAITQIDLWIIVATAAVITFFLMIYQSKLLLIALSPEFAYLSGIRLEIFQLLFYIFLGIAVVLGIKMVGIILVSAMLVLPVSTARLYARSFSSLLFFTMVVTLFSTSIGIIGSYVANTPTGPSIVMCGVILFCMAAVGTIMQTTTLFGGRS